MDKFIEARPQRLCLMCGRCCRVATTALPYEEIIKLVNDGDEGAKDFLNIFEPYASIEAAKKVSAETVNNILKMFEDSPEDLKKVTFYKCKHISEDNLCKIYESRPLLCDRFPTSPWAIVPPGCGFEGFMFCKREELKRRMRSLKENVTEFESILNETTDIEKKGKLKSAIDKTKQTIELFSKYGSADW